jgi:O-acetyl-ADP-ribose deacetylase (regulator of RNase III)
MMNRDEQVKILIDILLDEMPQYREQANTFPEDYLSQRRLLRSLMNMRPPMRISEKFLKIQDALLSEETDAKGIVDADLLPGTSDPRLVLWVGDITTLKVDAIVNAANERMLGCFVTCHACIDNVIHSAAGMQLRQACFDQMSAQGYPEPTGKAKITSGYNLPCKNILHTVGPIIDGPLTAEDCSHLADCYRSCLSLAASIGLESVAFCCISTGEFHFPQQRAAEIAVQTVTEFLKTDTHIKKVIFNVFRKEDQLIYQKLLYKKIPG